MREKQSERRNWWGAGLGRGGSEREERFRSSDLVHEIWKNTGCGRLKMATLIATNSWHLHYLLKSLLQFLRICDLLWATKYDRSDAVYLPRLSLKRSAVASYTHWQQSLWEPGCHDVRSPSLTGWPKQGERKHSDQQSQQNAQGTVRTDAQPREWAILGVPAQRSFEMTTAPANRATAQLISSTS